MSKLPNPKECKNHSISYIGSVAAVSNPSSYDLVSMHENFISGKKDLLSCDKELILIKSFDLINDRVYQSLYKRESESTDIIYQENHLFNDELTADMLGYSIKDDSLTLTLFNRNGEIAVVVVRHARDKDGNHIKWKTYGSKKYVPYKLHEGEDFVFLYSGMSELLLMELFGFSYIGLQSDSMVRHLPEELKLLTQEKVIVLLQDNDDSFRKIVPTIQNFFAKSHKVIIIDFEKLLKKELARGYDFRDFCNQIGNTAQIKKMIQEEIKDEFRS